MSILERKIGYNFSENVALITGSSSGVGEKIAIYWASLGFKLVVTGRNEEKIKSVAQKCRQLSNQKVLEVKTDLLIDYEVEKLVEKTVKEFGRIDILVNGANITIPCSITDANIMDSYAKVINTNVRSIVLLTSLAVPHLGKTKGLITNLKSDSNLLPYESELPSNVSEAATDMLARTLALELKSKDIRVLTINSSIILSPSFGKNPWLSTTLYSRL